MMKKQSMGVWINLIAVILTIVSFVTYNVNISSDGYFKNASVGNMAAYCIAAIVLLIIVIAMGQLACEGTKGLAVEIMSGFIRIGVPVLLMICLCSLISARAEGLGFIYFSNEDVLLEIQTAENMSSAMGTILNMVLQGIATIVAMIAAFFPLKRKDK